ncbi:EndoU domain-containing protein [Nocardia huaxiensis]|uniref:EndoU domain-containing protein n=1 Tax=Nocardia huaxiensis TaxID=2755382 RepID=UPI001E546321|nr:EndoU domain-containing protein [Nocardia huaxiensis]UFS94324.1 EndoU domain-containing protein [Nocardia huaxiensis]
MPSSPTEKLAAPAWVSRQGGWLSSLKPDGVEGNSAAGGQIINHDGQTAASVVQTYARVRNVQSLRAGVSEISRQASPVSGPSMYYDGIPAAPSEPVPAQDPLPAPPTQPSTHQQPQVAKPIDGPLPSQPNPAPAPAQPNMPEVQPVDQKPKQDGPIPASPGQQAQPVVPAPAPVAVPAEGQPWQSAPNTTSEVVVGSGGQTIDSTVQTENGPVEVRARAEADGTYVWTAFPDGSHSFTFIPAGGTNQTTYTVPPGGDPATGATSVTIGDGKGNWVTDGVSPDGTPVRTVVEKQPDGVTYHETTITPGGSATKAYRPGNPEFSTPWVVRELDSNGYGYELDDRGRWEISPGADGKSLYTMLDSSGNTIATEEFARNGDLLSFSSANPDQRIVGMSLADARSKARDDFNKYFTSKYTTMSPDKLKDDPGLFARAQLIKVLDSLNADPNALVTIVHDGKNNLVMASFAGPNQVERVSIPLEKLGQTLVFDRHPDGQITDLDGNKMVFVDGVILRFTKSGEFILPPDVGTGIAHTSNRDYADGSVRDRKVQWADSTLYDYKEIPVPAGAPNNYKYYKVAGDRGLLVGDANHMWWATRPGEMLTIGDHLWRTALDVALIVGPSIAGRAISGAIGALRAAPRIRVGDFFQSAATPPVGSLPTRMVPGSAAPAVALPAAPKPAVPATSKGIAGQPRSIAFWPHAREATTVPPAIMRGLKSGPAVSAASSHTMFPRLGQVGAPAPHMPTQVPAAARTNSLVRTDASIAAQVRKVIFEAEVTTMIAAADRQAVTAVSRSGGQVVRASTPNGAGGAGMPRGSAGSPANVGGAGNPRGSGGSGTSGPPGKGPGGHGSGRFDPEDPGGIAEALILGERPASSVPPGLRTEVADQLAQRSGVPGEALEHVLFGEVKGAMPQGWHLLDEAMPDRAIMPRTLRTRPDGAVNAKVAMRDGTGQWLEKAGITHTFFPRGWTVQDVVEAGRLLLEATPKRGKVKVVYKGVRVVGLLARGKLSTFFPGG